MLQTKMLHPTWNSWLMLRCWHNYKPCLHHAYFKCNEKLNQSSTCGLCHWKQSSFVKLSYTICLWNIWLLPSHVKSVLILKEDGGCWTIGEWGVWCIWPSCVQIQCVQDDHGNECQKCLKVLCSKVECIIQISL